jgi:hypothetical protein
MVLQVCRCQTVFSNNAVDEYSDRNQSVVYILTNYWVCFKDEMKEKCKGWMVVLGLERIAQVICEWIG